MTYVILNPKFNVRTLPRTAGPPLTSTAGCYLLPTTTIPARSLRNTEHPSRLEPRTLLTGMSAPTTRSPTLYKLSYRNSYRSQTLPSNFKGQVSGHPAQLGQCQNLTSALASKITVHLWTHESDWFEETNQLSYESGRMSTKGIDQSYPLLDLIGQIVLCFPCEPVW